jgi:hypothetical protein
MKILPLLLVILLTSSCDKSDYVIKIKETHITHVEASKGAGYIIIDKKSAEAMAESGDVYVDAKFCNDNRCQAVSAGSFYKYDQKIIGEYAKVPVDFHSFNVTDQRSPFWLKNVKCIRIKAVKGIMGRTGNSDWNCSIIYDAAVSKLP